MRSIVDVVSDVLGVTCRTATQVRGGDTAAAFRIELTDGALVFAKTHASPPPDFFSTEAASLRWLRDGGARVPDVLAARDDVLVLEWVDEGRPRPTTETELGRELASLHRAGAPCFGRADRRTTGSLALANEPHATWSAFVGSCRFAPLARLAAQRRALAPATIGALERLAVTLDRFDDGAPPSRLHGDLWAGNRLVDHQGSSWLIDPAAHGGHREFDLAMMALFGGFGAACFEAYDEASPLADGWRERVTLHQVAPLVVHAIKFGGGYVAAATQAIDRYA
jgi:fructosamine-3-kinase